MDSPGQRQFGGPDLLQLMAESCSRVGEWKVYAAAVLSFATLCRVGEISSLRRSNISKVGITYQGIKRDHRQITRRLGPYAQAWATWLRRIAPGQAPALGRAADLEMGMAKLLQGTDRGEARWHAWRRAGAAYFRWLGLPWRHLLWWGRWHSIKIAHLYASPPTNLNVCRLRDCLGQPLKESAGERPTSGTSDRPASWSSSKMRRKSARPRRRPSEHDPQVETAGPKRGAPQRYGRSAQDARERRPQVQTHGLERSRRDRGPTRSRASRGHEVRGPDADAG